METYVYDDGISKELLCLSGTVQTQFKGNRYNIPVQIWLQEDHPVVPPMPYVTPTSDMYISRMSLDVQADGLIVLPYLKSWHHVKSFIVQM